MHTTGTGFGICPASRIVLQEGKTLPLGVVPMKPDTGCLDTECLDMGCRSVVNCTQFAWGGGLAIPLLVIERRI